uniref:Wound-induced serine protease inhibitor-1 n=1 Tax=Zea mays TaxID=4577 RepID=A0A068EY53_MAIZE|nr:wound-induced serine protease inhibitor-1 [Zea mays]
MKSSPHLVLILCLQAALVMGVFAALAKENALVESKAIDINPGQLKCCTNCNFSFSGLYTCDDVKKDCDPVCKKSVGAVHASYSGNNKYRSSYTFLAVFGPKS